MGQDKALVPFQGRPLIRHGLDVLSTVFPEIVIVGREPGWISQPGVVCIPDDRPGIGPLGGLATALRWAQGRAVFLVGCDMPFLKPSAIELILERLPGAQAVIPVVGGRLQTLHAVYDPSCLETVETQIGSGERSMRALAAALHVRLVDEQEFRSADLESVRSLNHPEDLDRHSGDDPSDEPGITRQRRTS